MNKLLIALIALFCIVTTAGAQSTRGRLKGKGIKANPPTVYWNTEQEYTATCPSGSSGTPVEVVVLAHTYSSTVSQSEANSLALSAAQTQALALISCTPDPTIYYNTFQSYTANCPPGTVGSGVTVNKNAGTYQSFISVADANAIALAAATNEANAALVCTPTPTTYVNTEQQYTASCPAGYIGSPVTITKLAGTYTSLISIADANAKALAAATAEANAALACVAVYYNTQQQYTANCPSGYTGTPVTKTKLANTYQSFISVADANAQALAAATAEANAALVCNQIIYYNSTQSYTATCPSGYSGTPVTVTKDTGTFTSTVSQAAANTLAYNAAQTEAQAAIVCTVIPTVYWNTQQGYTATCPSGYAGNPVTVVIPANTYSSTSSIIAANTLALNAATAQANAQLNCTLVATCATSAPGVPTNAFRFYFNDHTRETVQMINYGISGTSVSGLNQLNSDLRGPGKPSYLIVSPNNTVSMAANDANGYHRWVEGIEDFKLTGVRGLSKWQTTSSSENWFSGTSPFFPKNQTNTGDGGGQGFRFHEVAAGSYTITLVTPSQATNFSVGEPVLLAGQEFQYAGMPPNPQYCQWDTVVSANATTGVITLKHPLRNDWFGDDWWESSNFAGEGFSFGKPRIMDLWKGAPSNFRFTRHQVFENISPLKNTISTTAAQVNSADTMVWYNVQFGDRVSVWPSQDRIAVYIKCRMDDSEPDKIVDSAFYETDTIDGGLSSDNGFTGGTGINYLDVRNSRFHYTGLNPNTGYWESNYCERSNGGFGWYIQPMGKVTYLYMFKNNTFVSPGNNEGATSMGFVNNMTVDGSNVQIVNGSDFSLVNDYGTGTPTYSDKTRTLRIGSPIWTSSGKVAWVTNVDFIGNRFIIRTNASGSNLPTGGETWNYTHCWQMKDYGCNTHSVYGIPFLHPYYDSRWAGDTTSSLNANHLSIFDEDDIKKTHNLSNMALFGKVDSFTVNVRTASTITNPVFLRVMKGSTELFKINLKQTGKRTFGVSGNSGFVGTDVANSDTPLDTWCNDISIQMVNADNSMVTGANSSNEGEWDVRMKWWPYKNN